MKNLMLSLGAAFFMTTAYVCGCGVCKANAADKTVNQFSLSSKEEPKTVTLKITGMSCAGCASHIHTALSKTGGIISDEVKFPGNVATVKYDVSKISVEDIIMTIEKAGYKAEVQKEEKEKKEKNKQA